MSHQAWEAPATQMLLGNEEVHVWRASLAITSEQTNLFKKSLSREEAAKAERFHFPEDRHRYIAAHGILRMILGGYLGQRAEALNFETNAHGKPSISGDSEACFNLSHSGDLGLIAVTKKRQVGVDIERIDSKRANLKLAQRFFSPKEVSVLQALPQHAQTRSFFNCWTRKEAYIKARGQGLSIPLGSFSVSLAPGEAPRLLHSEVEESNTSWMLWHLEPAPGYVGAAALEGQDLEMKLFNWDPSMVQ